MDFVLSDKLKQAINIAQAIAKEFMNAEFSPAHLLKALLHKEIGLIPLLEAMKKDFYYMEEWAEMRIETYPKASKISDQPKADIDVKAVFNEADNVRLKISEDTITPECVLIALTIPGVGFTYEQLKTFNLKEQELLDQVIEQANLENVIGADEKKQEEGTTKRSTKKQTALLKYCTDLTTEAQQGKLDPVVSRDKEIRMMAEILGRRSKPNVIIMGDPGVGKTALVHGFAQNIVADKVPENLKNVKIFELDFGSLIAGASYKGEVEDRLKNIIKEIEQYEKAILFIDEIHMLLDNQAGASGAANLLKPELDKGKLTVIGTTSIDNYTKTIENDEAFKRKFEILKIEEPDTAGCLRMLEKIIPVYEEHHKIKVNKENLEEAVLLSKRYLKERCLPDAAIDLIDRSMAVVKMMQDTSQAEIESLRNELSDYIGNKNALSEEELKKEILWFNSQLKERLSPVILIKLNEEQHVESASSIAEMQSMLNKTLENLSAIAKETNDTLEKSDLAAVVAHKTGVPIGKVQTQEKERLLNIESHLQKRVVGQNHGIKSIAEAIRESRSGLSKPGQPIGSFFFLGPTGTGKTELAKTLAEFLFNDETALIRFDMSEFKEEHSAALLYGAPPGYVGYEEGGLLVNKIRQKPYAIVLFDEIEKAHTSVFDIFLQILDEGKLHDRLGKEGDFSNAVILFTSNIGSSYIVDEFAKGNVPPSDKLAEIMENYFRPEFLGRLTEIIPFAPISEENVVKIFDIHLKNLYKSLAAQGIELIIQQEAKEVLAKSGFTPKFGARPLLGVIRNKLRRPLSKKIIAGEISKGSKLQLSLDENKDLKWETLA
ncbi:ATP-dependent Clp protease ATP-binding subunit [uncultured Draconibacterium sp.]|uniref:ATP-dependent Clp protease ATP-binding subunit n=1 Tax=uncultured Draconibacterium sp. TaxID=1573823 RepID=UPI0025F1A9C1|nr:ATP-dependent Clp protease ATP-binding subunit [uncultured Draconibacterium sp.]